MLVFSHRFTFGLCVSVIALTAVVVVSVTLMLHKQQDNALLLQRIDTLKAENAVLREQVHRYTAADNDLPQQGLAQPEAAGSATDGNDRGSDS